MANWLDYFFGGQPRQSPNVENRENEPWPTADLRRDVTALPQSLTPDAMLEVLAKRGSLLRPPDFPPLSTLGAVAGGNDIAPPTREELMNYLMANEATGPDPKFRRPGGPR